MIEDITSAPPHTIVKRGIAQSPEGRRLFPRMTVLENLEMGAFQRTDRAAMKDVIRRSPGASAFCRCVRMLWRGVFSLIGFDPADEDALWVSRSPNRTSGFPIGRMPLNELVSYERYEQRAANEGSG